jgi:hypothetical protein
MVVILNYPRGGGRGPGGHNWRERRFAFEIFMRYLPNGLIDTPTILAKLLIAHNVPSGAVPEVNWLPHNRK